MTGLNGLVRQFGNIGAVNNRDPSKFAPEVVLANLDVDSLQSIQAEALKTSEGVGCL